MTEELLERLRPAYALLSAGRYDEWVELLDPEVVCRQSSDIIGSARDFRGREGARAMMAELNEAFETITWEPVEAVDYGDGRYLVRVRTSGVARASRVALGDREIAHVITVRDGLTAKIEVFMSWGDAVASAEGASAG